MSAASKRAMFVRIAVVLGLATYIGLFAVAVLSVLQAQGHLWQSQSARFPAVLSDAGLAATLALAGPFVMIAAFRYWRDPNRD